LCGNESSNQDGVEEEEPRNDLMVGLGDGRTSHDVLIDTNSTGLGVDSLRFDFFTLLAADIKRYAAITAICE
jgi:hypothetical protein